MPAKSTKSDHQQSFLLALAAFFDDESAENREKVVQAARKLLK